MLLAVFFVLRPPPSATQRLATLGALAVVTSRVGPMTVAVEYGSLPVNSDQAWKISVEGSQQRVWDSRRIRYLLMVTSFHRERRIRHSVADQLTRPRKICFGTLQDFLCTVSRFSRQKADEGCVCLVSTMVLGPCKLEKDAATRVKGPRIHMSCLEGQGDLLSSS